MLQIYTHTQDQEWLQSLLPASMKSEICLVASEGLEISESSGLWVSPQGIHLGPAWFEERPGYMFPDFLPADEPTVLSLLEILLGAPNPVKTESLLPSVAVEFAVFQHLLAGQHLSEELLEAWRMGVLPQDPHREYRMAHNMAMLLHYGNLTQTDDMPSLRVCYEAAIETAPSPSMAGFSIKHFATLLADLGRLEEAKQLIGDGLSTPLSQRARISLSLLANDLIIDTLPFPTPPRELEELTTSMWNCLAYLEEHQLNAHTAMLLISASRVANLTESFSESLGYINRSLNILSDLALPELTGNALMQKGNLLYTWAQQGSPQFYRPAVETYQQAVRIFTKEDAPQVFATIQHHLAVLYSEMPDENKKRHIWAAVSVRCFEEALSYFTKDRFPYEYGMICNNYGNALIKFPQARNIDHTQMSLDYYREALQVRPADHWPQERALTLLNFLEASWKVGNPEEGFNQDRYQDMLGKAREVKTLTDNPSLLQEAERHLEMLDSLIKTMEHA